MLVLCEEKVIDFCLTWRYDYDQKKSVMLPIFDQVSYEQAEDMKCCTEYYGLLPVLKIMTC